MKKLIIYISSIVFFLLFNNCKTTKENIIQENIIQEESLDSTYIKTLLEKELKIKELNNYIHTYKDSLGLAKALLEKSQNIGLDSSYLETSYSFSIAKILNGKLFHTIENKDSVPTRIIYEVINKEKESKEEFKENKQDSIQNKKNQNFNSKEKNKREIIKTKSISIFDKIKWFALGFICNFIICFLIYKLKMKK